MSPYPGAGIQPSSRQGGEKGESLAPVPARCCPHTTPASPDLSQPCPQLCPPGGSVGGEALINPTLAGRWGALLGDRETPLCYCLQPPQGAARASEPAGNAAREREPGQGRPSACPASFRLPVTQRGEGRDSEPGRPVQLLSRTRPCGSARRAPGCSASALCDAELTASPGTGVCKGGN